MRISKKFSGYNMGKHTYVPNNMGFRSPVSVSTYSTFDDYVEPVQKVRRISDVGGAYSVVTHLMPGADRFSDTSQVWSFPSWSVHTPVADSLVDPETCTAGDEYFTASSPLFPYLVSQARPIVVEKEVNEWKSFDEFVGGVTTPYCTDDAHLGSNKLNISIPEDNGADEEDEWKAVLLHYCGNIFIGKNPVTKAALPVPSMNSSIAASTPLVTASFPALGCFSASSSYGDVGSIISCDTSVSVADGYVDAYYSDEEVLASLIDDL
jgi:hypothetical protein